MWLAREYLGSARGQVSVAVAVIAVAVAFTVLAVMTSAPGEPDVGTIAIFSIEVLVAEVALVVGAMGAVRPWLVEIATLRILGWPRWRVQLRLMLAFAAIGSVVGVPALLLAWATEAALGYGWLAGWPESGWRLVPLPGALAMVLAGAWWPARRVLHGAGWMRAATVVSGTVVSGTVVSGTVGSGAVVSSIVFSDTAGDGWADWVPARAALKNMAFRGIVIAGAGIALSLELAVRWAWLRRPVSWQAGLAGWGAIAMIVVLAVATVGDLYWLAARDRAGEVRTLRAMGWPARRLAWMAGVDAALLGSAGGLVAGGLDIAGSVTVAHRMPQRMLAVVAIVVAASVVISLLAAGTATLAQVRYRGK